MNPSQIAQIAAQVALLLINSQVEAIEAFVGEHEEVKPAVAAFKQVVDRLNEIVQNTQPLSEPEQPQL
jgi:hypothetical protein